MSINTFIFMGRPGAGKGVQSALLAEYLKLPIFSTGNKVREIAKGESALSQKIKQVSESGGLTPYWFASYLFQEALFKKKDGEGLIFEGVGRKEPEARLFAEINTWLGNDFRVLHLNASPTIVTDRLIRRGKKEGRVDDNPDKIKVRLESFDMETQPALEYMRSIGKVIEIDGEPEAEKVFEDIKSAINKLQ